MGFCLFWLPSFTFTHDICYVVMLWKNKLSLSLTVSQLLGRDDVSDLQRLRDNRRVSVHPLTLSELGQENVKEIIDSSRCEEVKLHMIRPSTDPTTWAGQVLQFYL